MEVISSIEGDASYSSPQRSIGKVKWSAGGKSNIYRVGHKGKVIITHCVWQKKIKESIDAWYIQ